MNSASPLETLLFQVKKLKHPTSKFHSEIPDNFELKPTLFSSPFPLWKSVNKTAVRQPYVPVCF